MSEASFVNPERHFSGQNRSNKICLGKSTGSNPSGLLGPNRCGVVEQNKAFCVCSINRNDMLLCFHISVFFIQTNAMLLVLHFCCVFFINTPDMVSCLYVLRIRHKTERLVTTFCICCVFVKQRMTC